MEVLKLIVKILIGIIATEHLYFLWLEMFVWTSQGPKIFKKVPEQIFQASKSLAANQGLYNGFLSAGLVWSLFVKDPIWSLNIGIFFLLCVLTAGIFGAFTVSSRIFFVQAFPALVTLVLIFFLV
jgi:putative membrane protein